jgi:hypothetical protein
MKVITTGQKFFINETGLFCAGNREFDAEWNKNNNLNCYDGELLIYRRDKIKEQDLIEQKIDSTTIGKINNLDQILYFEIFIDDDSFKSLDNEIKTNIENLRHIMLDFQNPENEEENRIDYLEFSEYSQRDNHIKWYVPNSEKQNYLKVNDINFNFKRMDIENDFYMDLTDEEKQRDKIESQDYRMQKLVAMGIDETNIKFQITNLLNEIQRLKTFLLIVTTCVLIVSIKYIF